MYVCMYVCMYVYIYIYIYIYIYRCVYSTYMYTHVIVYTQCVMYTCVMLLSECVYFARNVERGATHVSGLLASLTAAAAQERMRVGMSRPLAALVVRYTKSREAALVGSTGEAQEVQSYFPPPRWWHYPWQASWRETEPGTEGICQRTTLRYVSCLRSPGGDFLFTWNSLKNRECLKNNTNIILSKDFI